MNLFTRTFSKIFKSSNQQELDKIKNIVLSINNKEGEINKLSENDFKEKTDVKYEKIPLLCEKLKVEKNLINPIYLS